MELASTNHIDTSKKLTRQGKVAISKCLVLFKRGSLKESFRLNQVFPEKHIPSTGKLVVFPRGLDKMSMKAKNKP